jgi:hypothetical protein
MPFQRFEEYPENAEGVPSKVYFREDPNGQYVEDGNGGFKLDPTLNPDYQKPIWKIW